MWTHDGPPGAGRMARADDSSLMVFARAPDRYEIRHDDARRYLQLHLAGTWDAATFERFAADYRAAMAHLATLGGTTHLLVDASLFAIQPPEVAERFPALIGDTPRRADQRTACVVPSLVNRAQARPGGDLVNARYFRTPGDAADWLFGDEA